MAYKYNLIKQMSDFNDVVGVIEELKERTEDLNDSILDLDLDEKTSKEASKMLDWITKMEQEYTRNNDDLDEDEVYGALEDFDEKLAEFEEQIAARMIDDEINDVSDLDMDDDLDSEDDEDDEF